MGRGRWGSRGHVYKIQMEFVFQCLLLCLCWFFSVSLSHFSPSTIYWITLEQKINDFVYIACIYFCQDTVGGRKTVYKGMKVKKLCLED